MNRGKLIAGIIWLIVGTLLLILLVSGIQKLLIAGTELLGGVGDTQVSGEMPTAADYDESTALPEEPDAEPTEEPEELVEIPVEETAEELARENGLPTGDEE